MAPTTPGGSGLVCVWDSSALLHAGRAHRLDVLGVFVKGTASCPWQHYVPATVAEELGNLGVSAPDWASEVHVDGLNEIVAFSKWSQRLVSGPHNRGEAAVAAWAQSHTATAIIDDNDARVVAQQNGLDAHGSIWLLCEAIKLGAIRTHSASTYFDAVISAGGRFPFVVGGFEAWARGKRLLP